MQKPTLALRSTVTRRQAADTVDQAERQRQDAHHQAAEDAAQTTVDAATAPEVEQSGKDLKRDAHALQVPFLSAHLNKLVVIFLVNGLRLTGRLKQYDQFTVLLEGTDGGCPMVFKHAITTIAPASDAPGKQGQPQQGGTYP